MSTQLSGLVQEASDYLFYATLVDQAGVAIDPGLVSAVRATLRDELTQTVLWSDRDVLNANGGALVAAPSRNFSLHLTPTDTASHSGKVYQRRVLTLHVTHSAGKQHHQAFTFLIENLTDVAPIVEG